MTVTVLSSQEVIEKLHEYFTPEEIDRYRPEMHPTVSGVVVMYGDGPNEVDYASVPDGREILITRKTGEAVLRGADVFIPGVLATGGGIEAGDLVIVSVYTGWQVITRGSVLDERIKTSEKLRIGIGICQHSRTAIFRDEHGVAVRLTESIYRLPPCNGLLQGLVMLQNLPSVVTARVMDPQPGWHVLDMCAAPGGKTTAIAEQMQNTGEIIALDRTHTKVASVMELAEELGLTCIQAYRMDATAAMIQEKTPTTPLQLPSVKETKRHEQRAITRARLNQQPKMDVPKAAFCHGFPSESFDAVLLDAPCSALGLRPRLLLPHTLQELQETAQYQRKLLTSAVQFVKPGGTLVYSTCTINPGENEANVRWLLDSIPELELVRQHPYVGEAGLVGERWLTSNEAALVQRFRADGDTIGFFIAKFTKSSSKIERCTKQYPDT